MKVKCIAKIRNSAGKILDYALQDQQGKILSVKAYALKLAIKQGKIEVINLTLTSDNRLIGKVADVESQESTQKNKLDIDRILNRAHMTGRSVIEIPTYCKKPCYLISSNETHHLVVIPDNVTDLNGTNKVGTYIPCKFTDRIKRLRGVLKVIGGSNLESTCDMFASCEAQTIDLRLLDTHNVIYMCNMFDGCRAKSLDLRSFNTSKVTDMSGMFYDCKAKYIDLSSFDTSSVVHMQHMFGYCEAQHIDLSSFDTSSVTDMGSMFFGSKAQQLILPFDISRVTYMREMFVNCQAEYIDISSFDTSHVEYMENMFDDCKAQVKATDSRILEELNNR